MEKIKAPIRSYWNWRSENYGYDADKSVAIASKWESVLTRLVSGAPGRRALDIGTGRGQLAVYLARSGFEVTGIDLSEKMISKAGEYAERHGLDIDFRTGDAEKLGFDDGVFDVVVSRNLLWTLPRPDEAIREWRRVMKPGGRLVVSDGFWRNTTWRSFHHLAFRVARGMLRNGDMVSARFFRTYAGLQKSLPFYEGIRFEEAGMLLRNARFTEISSYDTSGFGMNPYGKNGRNKNAPSFFIAHAKR